MARLLGFQKRSGTGQASEEQMLRIIEQTFLNRTEGGEFTNPAEIEAFQKVLKSMPQTPDVMERMAELENKKLEFDSRQNDIVNSKAVFEDNLNDALRVEARNNYKDLGSLVGSYMNVYADAEEKIDSYISENVYKRYGTSAVPPQELMDLKSKIKEKARYYSTLNALMASPEGMASINSEGLGVQVQTNPLSGNIISVDVVPRSDLSKDYMQTDIKARIDGVENVAVPIFVNAQDDKTTALGTKTKYGRLGSIEFRGVDKLEGGKSEQDERTKELGDTYGIGLLKAQGEERGAVDWLKGFFTETAAETVNKGLESARTDGLSFNDFRFDGNDIPSGSVVRKGNKLYYQQENGDVSEFGGETYQKRQENAQRYLQQIGQNPSKINTPLYADDVYFIAPDGTSRVKDTIDENYFNPATPSTDSANIFNQPAATSTPQASAGAGMSLADSSFFGNKNRPNIPEQHTQTTTASVIEKGKSFFRGKLT